jgi:hypothetical protein
MNELANRILECYHVLALRAEEVRDKLKSKRYIPENDVVELLLNYRRAMDLTKLSYSDRFYKDYKKTMGNNALAREVFRCYYDGHTYTGKEIPENETYEGPLIGLPCLSQILYPQYGRREEDGEAPLISRFFLKPLKCV